MAKTTDELFAEATEADYETAEPVTLAASDTEEEFQFRIDEHLRTIAIPEKGVVAGVEGDLNVNIARFTMVRYYHGRDLSKLSIRINYRNANGQVNYYTVSDATVSGDSIVFSWEYAADVTQYKGNVQFVVYLFSATNATLKQRFFSTLGTLEVLEGLEVDSSIPASEQTDILLHLKKDLSAYAEEVKKSLPADYTAMTEQVSSLKEDIDNIKVTTEIKGTKYIQSGSYINGALEIGTWVLSKHFDVTGCSKIKAEIHTDQYYDIYDFVDASLNVLAFEREIKSDRVVELDLIVPENAKYFVLSGRNIDDSIVTGIFSLKNEETLKEIQPVSILNGFWNTDSNKFVYSSNYKYYLYDVRKYKRGEIKSVAFEFGKMVVLLDENNTFISDYNSGLFFNEPDKNYNISVNFGSASFIGISTPASTTPIFSVLTNEIQNEVPNLLQKTMVWFGTSIPAAGLYGLNNENSYPKRVGKILSANVFNESVGSSAITCKSPDRVSESNPYGFTHDFEGASRCMTNTIEEMNWIIEHYNDKTVFDYRTVSSLSDSDKDFIRSCSYENKLIPYLTDIKCPDLFVFDHGHNDSIDDEKESYYDETENLSGTEKVGWYSSGKYQDYENTDTKQSLEFDVSNYSQVLLSGKVGAWRDAYDLFDENWNNLGFEKVNTGVPVTYTDYEINVQKAKYLVVSNDNGLLSTISLKGYRYDRNHNLYCYRGAMRFLLNFIFSFNPKQRVVMIGEYENEAQPCIAKYQNKVADEWNLPIYRQWEEYGWSNNKIKTKWCWNNGVWTLGTKEQTITILNCWLADTVHPHSDSSGKTLQFMADHIASWMKNNIFLLN